jgi:hypothetical protein
VMDTCLCQHCIVLNLTFPVEGKKLFYLPALSVVTLDQ